MNAFDGKTYWLIGASEGIGAAMAIALSKAGATLVLSARSQSRLEAISKRLEGPATCLPFDLRDPVMCHRAADQVGKIDGMIFCAGVYQPMSSLAWDIFAFEQMMDVNFSSAARVSSAILPRFLEENQGHIVLIGSLAGFMGLPGSLGYGASKAALMQLGESMQMDLRGTGIRVQIVNPGFVRTRLTDKNDFAMPFLMSPELAADKIIAAMKSGRFVTSFPRHFSMVFRLGRLLPTWLKLRLFARN